MSNDTPHSVIDFWKNAGPKRWFALRAFCYLPFEHSEDPADQQRSLVLNQPLGATTYHWATEHAEIIQRFGRFPHRNEVLARATSDEERVFLNKGGFAG